MKTSLRTLIAALVLCGLAPVSGPAFAADEPTGPQWEVSNASAGSYLEVGDPSPRSVSARIVHDEDGAVSSAAASAQNVSAGSYTEQGDVSAGAFLEK